MNKDTEKNLKEVFQEIRTCFGEALGEMVKRQQERARKLELMKRMLGCQHVQKSGMAHFDDGDKFLFTPDFPVKGSILPFRGTGVGQLLPDGTFDFVRKPRQRAQSKLIRKLAHGRVSETKDGAVQLTLKIGLEEGANIPITLLKEAMEGERAVVEYLSKVKR